MVSEEQEKWAVFILGYFQLQLLLRLSYSISFDKDRVKIDKILQGRLHF